MPQGSILGPQWFGAYIQDLSSVVNCLKLRFYVDDTQGFVSCAPSEVQQVVGRVNRDLDNLVQKFCSEHLLVNPKKTQVIVFGTAPMLRRIPEVTLTVGGTQVEASKEVTNLGVIMDASLTMTSHVEGVASKCIGALRQISQVRQLFDRKSLSTLVDSLVFSRLYYCASLFSGISQKSVNRLQRVQNYAAKVVLGGRKTDHASHLIRQLGWLRVGDELEKRSLVMSYKIRNGAAPAYLSHLGWGAVRDDRLRHRNVERTERSRTQLQSSSFHHRMARTYPALPDEITGAGTVSSFKSRLHKFLAGRG